MESVGESQTLKSAPVLGRKLAAELNLHELEGLKFRTAAATRNLLDGHFQIPKDKSSQKSFNSLLSLLLSIQPLGRIVKDFGIQFIGRPAFLTTDILQKLQAECSRFESRARYPDSRQVKLVYQPDTPDQSTVAEKFASSAEVLKFVCDKAGVCRLSRPLGYIYYNESGHCHPPHVDNQQSEITMMLSLKHQSRESTYASQTVHYWPGRDRFSYQLNPGDVAIFFGAATLHGRTPVVAGETVSALLISFTPSSE